MEPTRMLHDWSRPQRQPWAGFGITLVKVLGQIIRFIWPIILIRLFRADTDGGSGRSGKVLLLVAAVLVLTLVLSFFQIWFFRFFIEHSELQVRKGVLKKEKISVPLANIQGVQIEESFLHRIFGIVKLSVDTAGSSKTEITIEALKRPMAEALRQALLQHDRSFTEEVPAGMQEKAPVSRTLLRLSHYDLLRLSITANHLETFVLIIAFAFSIYDDLRPLANRMLPGEEVIAQAGLLAVMMMNVLGTAGTFIVSTIRVLLRYYGYEMLQNDKGFALRFGLFNRRQRAVGYEKIQFLRWRANWLRRPLGLWILELAAVGENEMKQKQQNDVPLTALQQVHPIAEPYHSVPDVAGHPFLRIKPVYVSRMLLMIGIFPLLLALPPAIWWKGTGGLLLLLWPLFVGIRAWLRQRKFRCWLLPDAFLIRHGLLGEAFTLLKWYKIQVVEIAQSPYQRAHGMATLKLHTAAEVIPVYWIDLDTARRIADYAAYEVERSARKWM